MAQMTFTIDDAHLSRVLDGFADTHSWPDTGETKSEFLRRLIIQYVKNSVRQSEAAAALTQAESDYAAAVAAAKGAFDVTMT